MNAKKANTYSDPLLMVMPIFMMVLCALIAIMGYWYSDKDVNVEKKPEIVIRRHDKL